MKLTDHFKLKELIGSSMALRLGISNEPTKEEVNKLKLLAEKLEAIRIRFDKPIIISSGFRGEELNKAIGGSSTSQHVKCEAVDINLGSKAKNKELFDFIKKYFSFDQMINEYDYNWIHVSFKANDDNREQVLRAVKINKRTKYILEDE